MTRQDKQHEKQQHDAVEIVRHDGWAELVLNRPERKNAINGPLGEGLAAGVQQLCEDNRVRLILLRGAGGAFCSGLDLKAFNEEPAPAWRAGFQQTWRAAHRALYNADKPVLGVLEKYAINGGAALALACDLLMVGRGAFLQVGEVQIGMAAPYNLAWLSLRHSENVQAEVALLGERLAGEKLLQLGIAHFCEDDGELLQRGRDLAARLAAYEGHGLVRIKAGIRARRLLDADAWFDRFTAADPVKVAVKPKAMGPA